METIGFPSGSYRTMPFAAASREPSARGRGGGPGPDGAYGFFAAGAGTSSRLASRLSFQSLPTW